MKSCITISFVRLLLMSALLISSYTAHAFESFKVEDIKLEGLQRISIGTVFNYLPIKPGDTLQRDQVVKAIRILYKTGFFKDIHIEREGNVLVVFVAERPAINEIKIEGYDTIPEDQLKEGLKHAGIVQGRVLNSSILDRMERELQRQYYSLGKYAVKIETQLTQLERNRVDITIKLAEGDTAEIYSINIIGNKVFSDEKLASQLELADPSLFGSRNNYSKQQLAADLETLKSFYLDRGYLNFQINSTQVSMSPDKQSIYISVNVSEGAKFIVRKVSMAGDFVVPKEELQKLVLVKEGETFSRRSVTDTTTKISERLAEDGYAFANVNTVPDIDEDSKTVSLSFYIDPGRKIYVRRINVSGNRKTKDSVLRREMRQLENDYLSTKHVARSKTRLNRLGYFDEVSVETKKIPGSIDQVDLNYSVTERPTGSLQAGIGYSDSSGALVNFSVTQENFMGTGDSVGIKLENSDVTKNYSFNYTNPYYTDTGVSRGFSLSYRNVDAEEANISNYSTDSYGATLFYGIPVSEYDTVRWGMKYDNTEIIPAAANVSYDVLDFIAGYGAINESYQVFASWVHDRRNKRIFADRGNMARLGAEVAIPGGDLEFYKIDLRYTHYFPITDNITLAMNATLGYGDGYGDSDRLPPYEHYFAGGGRSVRGYAANSLGPRDAATNDSVGGNVKTVANIDLILPNPFIEHSNSTRLSLFMDAGQVYDSDGSIDKSELRYSMGVSWIWLTPVGAMRFNFSDAINEVEGDDTKSFEFSLGAPF